MQSQDQLNRAGRPRRDYVSLGDPTWIERNIFQGEWGPRTRAISAVLNWASAPTTELFTEIQYQIGERLAPLEALEGTQEFRNHMLWLAQQRRDVPENLNELCAAISSEQFMSGRDQGLRAIPNHFNTSSIEDVRYTPTHVVVVMSRDAFDVVQQAAQASFFHRRLTQFPGAVPGFIRLKNRNISSVYLMSEDFARAPQSPAILMADRLLYTDKMQGVAFLRSKKQIADSYNTIVSRYEADVSKNDSGRVQPIYYDLEKPKTSAQTLARYIAQPDAIKPMIGPSIEYLEQRMELEATSGKVPDYLKIRLAKDLEDFIQAIHQGKERLTKVRDRFTGDKQRFFDTLIRSGINEGLVTLQKRVDSIQKEIDTAWAACPQNEPQASLRLLSALIVAHPVKYGHVPNFLNWLSKTDAK